MNVGRNMHYMVGWPYLILRQMKQNIMLIYMWNLRNGLTGWVSSVYLHVMRSFIWRLLSVAWTFNIVIQVHVFCTRHYYMKCFAYKTFLRTVTFLSRPFHTCELHFTLACPWNKCLLRCHKCEGHVQDTTSYHDLQTTHQTHWSVYGQFKTGCMNSS